MELLARRSAERPVSVAFALPAKATPSFSRAVHVGLRLRHRHNQSDREGKRQLRSIRGTPLDRGVSGTVKDLVPGSGLEFEDSGVHELKGIPGDWRLFAVSRSS